MFYLYVAIQHFIVFADISSSCIHHPQQIVRLVSRTLSRLNAAISRSRLSLVSRLSLPSASALRPPVAHRGVHRPVPGGLQAVQHAAQPGLASPSRRYQHHTHLLCIPGMCETCEVERERFHSGGGLMTKLMRWSETENRPHEALRLSSACAGTLCANSSETRGKFIFVSDVMALQGREVKKK